MAIQALPLSLATAVAPPLPLLNPPGKEGEQELAGAWQGTDNGAAPKEPSKEFTTLPWAGVP